MPTKIYKPQLKENINTLFNQGIKIPDIMSQLNISRKDVFNNIKPEILAKIDQLSSKGMSNNIISKQLGVPRTTFSRWLVKKTPETVPAILIPKKQLSNFQRTITKGKIIESKKFESLRPTFVTEIKRLLLANYTLKDIARFMILSYYDLVEVLKPELYRGYLQLNSLETLSDIYHMKTKTISRYLREAGFTIVPKGPMSNVIKHYNAGDYNHWIPITPQLQEVITGELLGDGTLAKFQPTIDGERSSQFIPSHTPTLSNYKSALEQIDLNQSLTSVKDLPEEISKFNNAITIINESQTTRFRIVAAIAERNWINHISQIFIDNGYPAKYSEYETYEFIDFKKIVKELVWKSHLQSKKSVQMAKFLQKWYPEGIKIVPRDIILSPTSMLHWHIGDGSAGKYLVALYTNNFTVEDVKFLTQLISKTIGINSQVYMKKDTDNPEKEYPIIGITHQKNISKFFDYLDFAHPTSLKIAKKEFPWKFDTNLRKKDIVDISELKLLKN